MLSGYLRLPQRLPRRISPLCQGVPFVAHVDVAQHVSSPNTGKVPRGCDRADPTSGAWRRSSNGRISALYLQERYSAGSFLSRGALVICSGVVRDSLDVSCATRDCRVDPRFAHIGVHCQVANAMDNKSNNFPSSGGHCSR